MGSPSAPRLDLRGVVMSLDSGFWQGVKSFHEVPQLFQNPGPHKPYALPLWGLGSIALEVRGLAGPAPPLSGL